jgi:hypothetical protein
VSVLKRHPLKTFVRMEAKINAFLISAPDRSEGYLYDPIASPPPVEVATTPTGEEVGEKKVLPLSVIEPRSCIPLPVN